MRSEGEGSLGEDVVSFPQLNSTRKFPSTPMGAEIP